MTNGKRRRMYLAVLAMCLLLIAGIGFQMWASLRSDRAIDYGERFLPATPDVLCPGDKFSFPVTIDINQSESVSEITEGWCIPNSICPDEFATPEQPRKPFVDPYHIERDATRNVPANLPPGNWQLRHCNETHASGLIDVTCWQVTVTVKDCR